MRISVRSPIKLKKLLFACSVLFSFLSASADPLKPYIATTSFESATSTLSSGCVDINSNVPGLAEAMSIDFKLDQGALVISDFEAKNRLSDARTPLTSP